MAQMSPPQGGLPFTHLNECRWCAHHVLPGLFSCHTHAHTVTCTGSPSLQTAFRAPSSVSRPARIVLTWARECVSKEHRTLEAPLRWLWCSVSFPGLSWKFSTIVLIQPRNLFSMTNLVSFQIVEYLCFPLHHGAGDSQEQRALSVLNGPFLFRSPCFSCKGAVHWEASRL